jgi:hypothetical protein
MQGSSVLGFQMGTDQGIYPWVDTLVMGNLMGRRFWVVFKLTHFVIYYMLGSGGFVVGCLQVITEGVLDPRLSWTDTCDVQSRQPVDLVHGLKTVKGLFLLVPPRTPRISGYDVDTHTVYVVICYMCGIFY